MIENVIQIKSGATNRLCKENYIWIPITFVRGNIRCLKNSTDDLIITCDEMIDVSDAMSINLNDKKATCKEDNYYISLTFLLATILLLITTICYYCIKHWSKQKYIWLY